jgi:hypothetical protein
MVPRTATAGRLGFASHLRLGVLLRATDHSAIAQGVPNVGVLGFVPRALRLDLWRIPAGAWSATTGSRTFPRTLGIPGEEPDGLAPAEALLHPPAALLAGDVAPWRVVRPSRIRPVPLGGTHGGRHH